MLLNNCVVEEGLYNGVIGDLKSLHFKDNTGPLVNRLKGYVIVDFPACSVPENKSLVPGMPSTYIPAPITMFRCKIKCCAMEAYPHRICKVTTGPKSQGMTIAVGKPVERVVLPYPETGTRVSPGLQMVMMSRLTGLDHFCIDNKVSDLDKGGLKKMGTSTLYFWQ